MASILIVDDEPAIRHTMNLALSKDGHSIAEAANGCEALAAVRKQAFDVILLDIYMPEKDGLETIGELRQILPKIKIVAVSGGGTRAMLDPLRVASQLGADVVLAKPFDIHRLRQTIVEITAQ